MAKSKHAYKTEREFEKLRDYLQEKIQQTESKGWQTRYKKELSNLKKSWAQRQRIAEMRKTDPNWTPGGAKRFKPTPTSLEKARAVRMVNQGFGKYPQAHRTNKARRRQEKILYGKPITKRSRPSRGYVPDIKRTRPGEQHLRQKIQASGEKLLKAKADGMPVEVAAANVHTFIPSPNDPFKEERLPIDVKDLKKMSKNRAMKLMEDPYNKERLTEVISKIKEVKTREGLSKKFGIEKPRYRFYTKRKFHGV